MPDECIAALQPAEGKVIADLTLGGGGHTERLLEAGATVYGFDQDLEAIQFASERLARFGSRFIPVHSNFCGIERELTLRGVEHLDGVLIDLGVSSRQLDAPERGFSFMREGPLDMRMDANDPTMQTAADLVNTWEAEELARIFFQYGEEKFSRKIAREIVSYRSLHPFQTTLELADLIERVVPKRGPKHPATRVFQALRIAVNHEMSVLEQTLDALPRMLGDGGRLAIITFHSLEDRMVKLDFRKRSQEMLDHESWPEPRPNPDYAYRLVKRKPLLPTDEEIRVNPRSRSAKVRVAERLPRK
ncbi:16S rRNA (cytosine(1402)-N(4))-methyltransferase RsmH [Sulfuriroseicoccus oceanibius]|uniref:Ribosomal RNA small subunit methyltransferase H n=2 Tax=Sulfuriroseicoccus oceanibius TaxID=2707525 RepID=A0A7T7F459_9BACT|nr:16S rRNA (cytosine(1402)-N(4))-methyltransferase RsmH [Sulfuriroseicoccus oceanibius]